MDASGLVPEGLSLGEVILVGTVRMWNKSQWLGFFESSVCEGTFCRGGCLCQGSHTPP